jgi:hypothetical protein
MVFCSASGTAYKFNLLNVLAYEYCCLAAVKVVKVVVLKNKAEWSLE